MDYNNFRNIPTSEKELSRWLDHFSSEMTTFTRDFGISEKEVEKTNLLIKELKREIQKSEIGLEMDHVYKGLVKNELINNVHHYLNLKDRSNQSYQMS
ncbi:MAG: hypothetical protein ACK4ND_04405 [Cytophagaceae bacterium]